MKESKQLGGGAKSHCSKEIICGFKPKKECNAFYLAGILYLRLRTCSSVIMNMYMACFEIKQF